MKLLAAIAAGVAFYGIALWLTHRYGVLWLFGAAMVAGAVLAIAT